MAGGVEALKQQIVQKILATDLADADTDHLIQALAEVTGQAVAQCDREQPLVSPNRLDSTCDALRRAYQRYGRGRAPIILAPPGFTVGA